MMEQKNIFFYAVTTQLGYWRKPNESEKKDKKQKQAKTRRGHAFFYESK